METRDRERASPRAVSFCWALLRPLPLDQMPRAFRVFLVLVGAFAFSCSSDDPKLERRGGPVPDPSGSAGDAAGGSTEARAIPFCDALGVIRAKCQRCHQDPPKNGAPAAFLTYEDTQAAYGSSMLKYSDLMVDDVSKGFMPFVALNDPPNPIMPPVEPLTPFEKATLLGWLLQGALPEGGTDCP
jgi:hypothetical protein